MRQAPFLLTGVVALVAAVAVWHPARVAIQTLLLLPALFPSAPVDPLAALTTTPVHDEQTATYAGGTLDTQFIAPAGDGRHPAIALLLGAGDLPRSDVAVHFAEALARLGIVVSLPEPSGMFNERLSFDEVDAIRVSIDALANRPDVDPKRIGLVGLSASGGLSIVAAAQPDLRDRVSFVNSFGSYNDALGLLVDVASQSMDVDGRVEDWQPEPRTVDVITNALSDAGVSESDINALLSNPSRERARQIIDGFSPDVRQRLAQVSPSAHLDQLHTHLYLMHDREDPFIPFTQSRQLVSNAPSGVVQRYTEFSIFEHVIPERPVPWQTFLPDVWRLFWHIHAVLLELL
jgi:dienelactone hydrolase